MIVPIPVTDVDLAFGGRIDVLLPAMKDIPEAFINGGTVWNRAIERMFYDGPEGIAVEPKEGVSPREALRHIAAVLVSFQPKHEHKLAGCAYLMSEFFLEVSVLPNEGEDQIKKS